MELTEQSIQELKIILVQELGEKFVNELTEAEVKDFGLFLISLKSTGRKVRSRLSQSGDRGENDLLA